jgi:hypothetical protein
MRLRRSSCVPVCDFKIKTLANYRIHPHLYDVNEVCLQDSKKIIIKKDCIKLILSHGIFNKETLTRPNYTFIVPCLKKTKSFTVQDLYYIISLLYRSVFAMDRQQQKKPVLQKRFKDLQLASLSYNEIKSAYSPNLY